MRLLPLVVVGAVACAPRAPSVQVALVRAADAPAPAAGAEWPIGLVNQGRDTLRVAPCAPIKLEQLVGMAWTAAREVGRPLAECPDTLQFLPPGGAVGRLVDLPGDLGAGRYRLMLPVEAGPASAPRRLTPALTFDLP